jgi:hypothetical protein
LRGNDKEYRCSVWARMCAIGKPSLRFGPITNRLAAAGRAGPLGIRDRGRCSYKPSRNMLERKRLIWMCLPFRNWWSGYRGFGRVRAGTEPGSTPGGASVAAGSSGVGSQRKSCQQSRNVRENKMVAWTYLTELNQQLTRSVELWLEQHNGGPRNRGSCQQSRNVPENKMVVWACLTELVERLPGLAEPWPGQNAGAEEGRRPQSSIVNDSSDHPMN